jgi:hypothetical protein
MRPRDLLATLRIMHAVRQSVYIEGKPGIGKSAIMRQFAASMGPSFGFVDIRLPYFDLVDMRGLPFPRDGKTTWLTPDFLPTAGEGIILLDEFSAAPLTMQALAYQLCLDRQIGDYRLPDGWSVHLAGNSQADRAIANRLSSAIVSRVAKYTLDINLDDWTDYALESGIHHEVLAAVRFMPDLLHDFNPKTWVDGSPYSCPRTLEKLSTIYTHAGREQMSPEMTSGIVGEGAATRILGFLQLISKLPNLDAIILDPKGTKLPESPGAMFAVSAGLARKATPGNIGKIMTYIGRLEKEYEFYTIKDALKITKNAGEKGNIANTPEFVAWMSKNQKFLN